MAVIEPGTTHACGLGGESLYCWGALSLDFGQTGTGGPASARPQVVGAGFASVATSHESTIHTFSCGLRTDGTALCWGANRFGQTGRATSDRCGPSSALCAPEPAEVSGGHAFASMALGAEFACGLRTDGEILCWGLNGRGQLGDGTTETRPEPAPVLRR